MRAYGGYIESVLQRAYGWMMNELLACTCQIRKNVVYKRSRRWKRRLSAILRAIILLNLAGVGLCDYDKITFVYLRHRTDRQRRQCCSGGQLVQIVRTQKGFGQVYTVINRKVQLPSSKGSFSSTHFVQSIYRRY
jgi:hypothetical protein